MNHEKVLKTILSNSHSVLLNMGDTFAFACADAETIEVDDLEKIMPLIEEHGQRALNAYAAVARGYDPIDCRCNHKGPGFAESKAAIQTMYDEDEFFMYDAKERRRAEAAKKTDAPVAE